MTLRTPPPWLNTGWRPDAPQAHLSLLRSAPIGALRPGLPMLLSHAEDSAQAEKMDLRQPWATLARIAAMAGPEEDDGGDAGGGGDLEELAQASAAAVPASVYGGLAMLLTDRGLEVRISALHAVKTLCKLRPALLRAGDRRVATHFAGRARVPCRQGQRDVNSAAQRCMMHLVLCCHWSESAPPSSAAVGKDASTAVSEFCRKHFKKLVGQESEAEHSDEEPV